MYTLWLFLLNGIVLAVPGLIKYRGALLVGIQQYWRSGLLGGLMQLISYGIAIWAMSQAPIVMVAAVRETSVLFAMFYPLLFLKKNSTSCESLPVLLLFLVFY
ncbi:hypothetical protein AB6E88_04030 [Providencia hangzhouensis]